MTCHASSLVGVSLGRHDIGNALATEVITLSIKLFRFYDVPMLRWHLQQNLLEQDHVASFFWLCYLPNSVATKLKMQWRYAGYECSTNIPQ